MNSLTMADIFAGSQQLPFDPHAGFTLRSMLNGVKQTAGSFARLYGLDETYLEAVMNGTKPLTREIARAVEKHGPLSARLLMTPEFCRQIPVTDDTEDGVVVFSAEARRKSLRSFDRGPKDGKKVPYYEYADTAMSKRSAFRPEWIRELFVWDGQSANLPDYFFNRGHLEYQLTYYIGKVNLHWIDIHGQKHVWQTETGDSFYVTPFVSHTFTTRGKDNGLILAVTYCGAIASEAFQTDIHSMDLEAYLKKIHPKTQSAPMPLVTDADHGLILRRYADARIEENDAYVLRELLSGIPSQAGSRVLEYTVKQSVGWGKLDMQTAADRWGYNVGEVPVVLCWGSHEREIEPGASFLISSQVQHAFRLRAKGQGRLAVLEIKPGAGDPYEELALIRRYAGEAGLKRVHTENLQWF